MCESQQVSFRDLQAGPRPAGAAAALAMLWLLMPAVQAVRADELPDIRFHVIVEASPEKVWDEITSSRGVTRWLFRRSQGWQPREGRFYQVRPHDGPHAAGGFDRVEPQRLIEATWPEGGERLRFDVTPIDEHLTMLSLTHADWPPKSDETRKLHAKVRGRWRLAMVKFHRLFPAAVVDTRHHRPKVDGEFVMRNLLVNGDFELLRRGPVEGVAFGWETLGGRSAPKIHVVDDRVAGAGQRSQKIARPPDWNQYAIQQFTPAVESLIEPGRRYRLTGLVRAEGISNPAGWYRLGLGFTDEDGQVIGDIHKNEPCTGADGEALLNHDWERYTTEAEAPEGAVRAVVILTGHWDEEGTVWYDDIRLWDAEPPPTTQR